MPEKRSLAVVMKPEKLKLNYKKYGEKLILSIALITVTFDVSTNQVSFTDNKERVFCIGIIILRQTLQTMKQV